MSRLIVKNLPKSITEDKLRDLFSQKGTITDVQLKYTKEGVFRCFAFIGFQTDEQAEAALKYFNNSCIQTSRIKVQVCAPLGSQEKPQSWSKYSKDSSAFRKKHGIDEAEKSEKEKQKKEKKKKNPLEEIIGEHKDDPQFVEFMQAHNKNRNLWDNDATLTTEENATPQLKDDKFTKPDEEEKVEKAPESESEHDEDNEDADTKLAEKEISDLDYMRSLIKKSTTASKDEKKIKKSGKVVPKDDLYTIKIRNVPFTIKRSDIQKFFKPLKPTSIRLPVKVHGICYVGFKNEKDFDRAMHKDKSFIKGKQVFLMNFTEKNKLAKQKTENDAEKMNGASSHNPKWRNQEENIKNEEEICESGKIFFRNLSYTVTEDDLQTLFEKYGPVAEVSLPIDPLTRKIKGFGTVTFVMPEHAVRAFSELDGTLFHGRLLHLIPGKSKDKEEVDPDETDLGFKAKKALKLKQSAGQSHNWNTLFLGSNAVANIMAKKFETSKETILDSQAGGSSAAVRLALGETQIVIEMKRFMEENDVCLDVFDTAPKKRSKTVILAKNLPDDTTVAELKPLFAKFGLLGRIVLPPSGVTAIIEFLDSSEARRAFKNLAYTKFKNLPLYLEWAPENTFKTAHDGSVIPEAKEEESKTETETSAVEEPDTTNNVAEVEEDDDEPPEPSTTLFLRNLNFKTREDAVRQHFKHLGPIHMVQVAMKKDPDNPSQKISLGYGFIQFKKHETSEKALKQMQLTQIEGNQVELKRSDRVLKTDERNQRKPMKSSKQTGTKILVRNIPFQAKANEVRDIFKAFGELKFVRLPLKMSPGETSHRGFGFVDFITKSDAKKAFDALCQSTHLYGRRLVLEWAENTEDNVEELRKRTAQKFDGEDKGAKRSKKGVFDSSQIGDMVVDDDV